VWTLVGCDAFISSVLLQSRNYALHSTKDSLPVSENDRKYYAVDQDSEIRFNSGRNAVQGESRAAATTRRGYQGASKDRRQHNNNSNSKKRGDFSGRGGRRFISIGEKHQQVDRILAACRNGQAAAATTAAGAAAGVASVKVDSQGGKRKLYSKPSPEAAKVVTLTEVNHAIVTAGRIGRIDDALEIFNAVEGYLPRSKRSSGKTASSFDFGPDLMTFNNIIWSAGNAGRFDLAKSLFIQLQNDNNNNNNNNNNEDATSNKKLRPNVYTYGSLMHGCVKAKAYKQALDYLDKMDEQGIAPNQIVFTSAMEACAESGQYKEATGVMDRMVRLGMKPDLTMVNAAIKACSLAGAMDDAETLAQTLREYGAMDVFTYHTLMMGNTKLARHHNVLSLYDEALASTAQLDGGVYSLAMLAALNSGLYVFCSIVLPSFLVCDVCVSVSPSYPSIAACLHSLTPHHDTSLTITPIPQSIINQHYITSGTCKSPA
jgi:pentatricopeptide repeat protein